MGRRNLPCSTVKAQTEKSIGARFGQQQQGLQQGERILAARERHGHAVAIANHFEAVDRLADLAQQCFFEVHSLIIRGQEYGVS